MKRTRGIVSCRCRYRSCCGFVVLQLVMSETDQLFLREIQTMMHGCGDCARPLLCTARIVASTVQQQVLNIVWRAEEQAARRGTRSVTPRDIIFLMRRDPDKLRRLYHYLSVKEMKSNLAGMTGASETMDTDDVEGDLSCLLDAPRRTRQSHLQDMFTDMDVTGELLEIINDPTPDPVRLKRDQRADTTAQLLDPTGYMEFAKARRAAFVNSRLSQQRFLEWISSAIDSCAVLAGEPPAIPRLTSPAIDILAYLAKETVATMIDLALLVRQDSSSGISGGPLRPLTLRSPSGTMSTSVLDVPLSPAEVREGLRRYWSPLFTQSTAFARTGPPNGNQLLAC